MEIAVIGAGPIGCYAGYLLAKSGHQVSIYEKKSRIGAPVQCTGLLTADFDQFNLPKEPFLVNTFKNIEVNSPDKQKIKIRQKEYLVCREKFDNYIADLAGNAGAKIFLNHSFAGRNGKNIAVRNDGGEIVLTPDLIIAADGPLSPTAKAFGFYLEDRQNYYGIQAVVEGNFDSGSYQVYFGTEICPELFAWIVPESESKARVGLAATKKARLYFDKLMKEHKKEDGFKVVELQAGTIPLYNPKQKLHHENCYLLGDAAGFVKATTLGGLIPGFKQAEILVGCINERINNDSGRNKNYHEEIKKDYVKAIKPLTRKLKLHLKMRNLFNKFSDRDWDKLISYVNQPKVQNVLKKYTREDPLPLAVNVLLREPRFLGFLKHFR